MTDEHKHIGTVIDVGDFSIEKVRRFGGCGHTHVAVNTTDETVHCIDCGTQLTPFYALRKMLIHQERIQAMNRAQKAALDELSEKHVHLRAARKIETAWRGPKKLAVCCPHCGHGILRDDGLGNITCSQEYELARRKRKDVTRRDGR